MKVMIDIDNKVYEQMKNSKRLGLCSLIELQGEVFRHIRDNGKILDDMTNREVIKAMFPNIECREKAFEIEVNENKNKVGNISANWWNAPYMKGAEECHTQDTE